MYFSYPDEYNYPVVLKKNFEFFEKELDEYRTIDEDIKAKTKDYYGELFKECDEEYSNSWI